jgi:hypothetical protein
MSNGEPCLGGGNKNLSLKRKHLWHIHTQRICSSYCNGLDRFIALFVKSALGVYALSAASWSP